MNPKSGKACKVVPPADPAEAFDADDASPGKVAEAKAEQIKQGKGKYGQTKAKPFKAAESDESEKSWIEIRLIDEENNPVPGAAYRLTMPDGSLDSGTLDENGSVRVEGIEPGSCQVTFPDLDQDAWEPA